MLGHRRSGQGVEEEMKSGFAAEKPASKHSHGATDRTDHQLLQNVLLLHLHMN